MATRAITKPSADPQTENELIRVEGLADQAGIAAALRKAFEAGRVDDCERDFAELLDRLN